MPSCRYAPKSGHLVTVTPTPASLIGSDGWIEPERVEKAVRIAIQSNASIEPEKTKALEHWREPSTTKANYEAWGGEYTTVPFSLPQQMLDRIRSKRGAVTIESGTRIVVAVRYWTDRWQGKTPPGSLQLAITVSKLGPRTRSLQPIHEITILQAIEDAIVEELNRPMSL
jgi:hypothetical protein